VFQVNFLTSEVDFDRYLWCSRAFGYFIVCLRCLILMLFVVAGHLFEAIACLQKSTLTAICRGRTWSVFLCFSSEVDFDRYLWCSRAILKSTCRCWARCWASSASLCFSSEVDFECYFSCLELLLEVQSVFL